MKKYINLFKLVTFVLLGILFIYNFNTAKLRVLAKNSQSKRVVIKYKSLKAQATIHADLSNLNKVHIYSITNPKHPFFKLLDQLEFTSTQDAQVFVDKYRNNPLVEYVEQIPIGTFNTWQSIDEKAYPGDFLSPNNPATNRHWYLEKIDIPKIWYKFNCYQDSNCMARDNPVVIAVIDTGVSVEGSTETPTNATFTYTNECDTPPGEPITADDCIMPIAEEGTLSFSLNFSKSAEIRDDFIWTNPDETNTVQCNDIHGVDMEIYNYNNANSIPNDCSNNNRAKEGIPADDFGHGTFIAHQILATVDNSENTVGFFTNSVKLMPIKVNIPFTGSFYVDTLATAIVYAVDNGADIINISAGTYYDVQVLKDAVEYAYNHNVLIVASTGNDGANELAYPADYTKLYPNVIAVGALDNNNQKASYSNYEDSYTLYAPVGNDSSQVQNSVTSLTASCAMDKNQCAPVKDTDDVYKKDFLTFPTVSGLGTSFAAPQVTAGAGLLLIKDPELSVLDLKTLLTNENTLDGVNESIFNVYNDMYSSTYLPSNASEWKTNLGITSTINQYIGDFNGDGKDDIAFAQYIDDITIRWFVKLSNGQDFQQAEVWINDFGNKDDQWYIGDFNGDGKDDIALSRMISDTTIRWYVSTSNGSKFNPAQVWVSDFGDKGDLTYVGDFNGDGKTDITLTRKVNSTTQRWYTRLSDGTAFVSLSVWSEDFGDDGDTWYIGDFNGDGKDDITLRRNVSSTTQSWYVSTSSGNSFTEGTLWTSDFGNNGDQWYIGDFNGDGKEELALSRLDSGTTVKWYVSISDGNNFRTGKEWCPDFGDQGDKWFVGDLNGDGKTDITLTRKINDHIHRWYARLSNGSAFVSLKTWLPDDSWYDSDAWYIGDFNGDGKDDLALRRYINNSTIRWYIALSDGQRLLNPTIWTNDFGNLADKWYIGDFNGDGKDDLALYRITNTTTVQWYVALSNGNSFNSGQLWCPDFGDKGDKWYVGDFNGDGKTDVTLTRKINSTTQRWYTRLSNGNAFVSLKVWSYDFGNDGDTWYIGDFNGDGKDDIALKRDVSSTTKKWYVAKSSGYSFKDIAVWASDFGNDGDQWYIGKFDQNSNTDDLLIRRKQSNGKTTTYLAPSNGTKFVPWIRPALELGPNDATWYTGQLGGSLQTDILYRRTLNATTVRWYASIANDAR